MQIELNHGSIALIDDADAPIIAMYKWRRQPSKRGWCAASQVKVPGTFGRGGHKQLTVYMHRLIMGVTDPKEHIDHINGDALDNRRANLRIVTPQQNTFNRKARADSQTGIRGVSMTRGGKFQVMISRDRKQFYVGTFPTIEEAKAAHRSRAEELFGEHFNPHR